MNNVLKRIVSSVSVIGILAYSMPVFATVNSETVYSRLNAQGENYKTIVTTKYGEEVEEKESSKETPIETKITYTLDGKEITPDGLAGKSGKVSIKIEYTNKLSERVNVNGKYETMYTPFVVVTGAIIENQNNKNIEVKNGKVIENGNKSVIVGISLPGVKDSLKLTGDFSSIEIPSYVEITMDSTNFSMKNIATYATPKLLDNDINWSKLDKIFSQTRELQDGANKLEDGTKELKDGALQLNAGAEELNAGASKLANGTDELYRTITAKLRDFKKIETKYTNKEELTKEISNLIKTELQNPEVIAEVKGMAQYETAKVFESNKEQLGTVLKEKVLQNITTNVEVKAEAMMETQIDAAKNQKPTTEDMAKVLQTEEASALLKTLISSGVDVEQAQAMVLQMANRTKNDTLDGVKAMSKPMIKNAMNTIVTDLSTDEDIEKMVSKLASDYTEKFISEIINNTVEDAISKGTIESVISKELAKYETILNEKINALNTTANTLQGALYEVNDGANKLKNGTSELENGTEKLSAGANTLADGMEKFNSEGIKKVYNLINGDLYNLKVRAQKLEELSNNYASFSTDEKKDNIKFITIIDSIKSNEKDSNKEKMIVTNTDSSKKTEE